MDEPVQAPPEYRSIVERILKAWSAYQLGLDLQSGDDDTKAKNEWFTDVLSSHLFTSRNQSADDLEQWITSVLYNDFDLILEDDSTYPTCCLILEAIGYLRKGDNESLNRILATLPTEEQVKQAKQSSIRDIPDGEEMDAEDIEEEMGSDDDEDKDNGSGPSRERQPRTVTDEDGWTTILRK